MCGVSGIMYFNKKLFVKKKHLDDMNNILNHRGPDGKGNGFLLAKNIGFGHTRLSILDLTSSANQPFVDKTKNYILLLMEKFITLKR